MFATFQSKATTSDKTSGYSYAVSSLSPNDIGGWFYSMFSSNQLIPFFQVPIVDAQKKQIKLPGGLTTIEKDFPVFEGVIPAGSLALVGYTVGKYTAKAFPNDVSLSLNLLWVAVLATDDDA